MKLSPVKQVCGGRWLLLASAVCLTGCTTTHLVVPCIAKDQVLPAEPAPIAPNLTGKADEDTRTLAGGLIRWQAYGRGLREILESCRDH